MTDDEPRGAPLLFADALARGELPPAALERREVRCAVRARAVLPRPLRLGEALAVRRGVLGYERNVRSWRTITSRIGRSPTGISDFGRTVV